MNFADQWLLTNAKYFPEEQLPYIRQRLETLSEERQQAVASLTFKDPILLLIVSIIAGELGIDRFLLGHIGLGIGKLLTAGGCGIWAIVDWFLIMGATREENAKKLYLVLG